MVVTSLSSFQFTRNLFNKIDRYSVFFTQGFDFQAFDSRYDVREFALSAIKEKPIFGHGFGYTDSEFDYPHNIVLEIFAELGVIGLIISILLFAHRWKVMKTSKSKLLILFSLFISLISGNISTNYFLFFFLFVDFENFMSEKKVRFKFAKN